MVIAWFSCGATSAVACKIALTMYADVRIVYIETGSGHPDNERFIQDCERWYGQRIERIRSDKYRDVDDVLIRKTYINGPHGAACTSLLKKEVRYKFEDEVKEWDGQVWGFDYGTAWRYGNASKDCITILTARSAVYIFCQIVMSNKNKNKSQQNEVKDYWREMEAERKVKDTRAKEFYEDRINDLLEMVGRGKGTRDYELQLVRIAAKNWMYLDRNRDSLRLSGAYKAKAYNPGEEENAIITESSHVKSVLRFRTILEGLFQAMGIPNRVAFECDESRIPRYQR